MFGIEEIVSLAALRLKIDFDSLDDHVSPSDIVYFKRGLDRLDATGFVLLSVAGKILEIRRLLDDAGRSPSIWAHSSRKLARAASLRLCVGSSRSKCKLNIR
jgi:hypothetical protein